MKILAIFVVLIASVYCATEGKAALIAHKSILSKHFVANKPLIIDIQIFNVGERYSIWKNESNY